MGYQVGNNDMLLRKIKAISLCLLMNLLLNGFVFAAYTVLIDATPYSFTYRRTITIQASQVQGGPHGNFPMLFDSTTTAGLPDDLKHVGEVPPGKVENSNGWDIVFAMGEDQPILKHEIDEYYPANGKYLSWVRIESLSGSTQLYIYYGSSGVESASKNTQHVTDVWDSNYLGVWHLKEDGDGTPDEYKDSSQYTNHGQGGEGDSLFVPTQVDGKIGYGQDFNNSDTKHDLVDCGDDPEIDITGNQITMQAWIRHNITPQDKFYGIMNHKGWYDGYSFWINHLSIQLAFNLPGDSYELISDNDVTTNVWHHVAATYDGSLMRIYIDGDPELTTLIKTDDIEASTSELDFWIGHGDQPKDVAWSAPWEGQIDEVRLSDYGRTGDWIKTEFYSQWEPQNFYQVSAEQTLVELSYVKATSRKSAGLLEWATETELDNAGFNLWRSEKKNGDYARINPYFIPAEGEAGFGAEYSYTDYDVQNGVIYYYKLEDINVYGTSIFHGPVPAIPTDLIPIWPPNRIIRPSDALVFSWSSTGSNSFKVEISPSPSFSASETLSFPDEGWTTTSSLWLSPRKWEMVLRKATHSGGQLFWRVRARSEDGREVYSGSRRFIIDH
jgi:hypothetical protein